VHSHSEASASQLVSIAWCGYLAPPLAHGQIREVWPAQKADLNANVLQFIWFQLFQQTLIAFPVLQLLQQRILHLLDGRG
jgi:hypothetical protein